MRVTPPAPGSRPRVTSGRPNCDFGLSSAIAVVAGERDLQAAAERGAVERGDDRLAERLQPAQVGLDRGRRRRANSAALSSVTCDSSLQVAAGEEGVLGRGDDHAGDRVLLGVRAGRPRPSATAGRSSVIVLARWFGSSRVSVTMPSASASQRMVFCRSCVGQLRFGRRLRSARRWSRRPCRRRRTGWPGRSAGRGARARR